MALAAAVVELSCSDVQFIHQLAFNQVSSFSSNCSIDLTVQSTDPVPHSDQIPFWVSVPKTFKDFLPTFPALKDVRFTLIPSLFEGLVPRVLHSVF